MTQTGGVLNLAKKPSFVDQHGLMHAISYAAQTPWLRHQSIKDNILFGAPLDDERYAQVVECCALKPDFDQLEDGDETEIGVRYVLPRPRVLCLTASCSGVSLSGGQKARVALARAVYARNKYVLLDDPLSAVDSHTARFLFQRLLKGPLFENRTVVSFSHRGNPCTSE
jgi:ABC-type multidrug transport system fused ATPase/permease subunit